MSPPPLAERLAACRHRTLRLTGLVEDQVLNASLHPEFSPLRWHLGHVAAFEAFWVLHRAGGRPTPEPEFDRLFDPRRYPKAERVHLPARDVLLAFAEDVRGQTLDILAQAAPDHPDPLLRDNYVGEFIYEHECQHQEILTFLLQMVPHDRKGRPAGWRPEPGGEGETDDAGVMIEVPAGTFRMGTTGGFAYDNESDPHEVRPDSYRIDRDPVDERSYLRFLEAGGYDDPSWWTESGWTWRRENDAIAPRDWKRDAIGGWFVRTMFEDRSPRAGVPVIGVSQFEAEAYARWSGKRLPTEAEWERAAAWDAEQGQARRFPWGKTWPDAGLANVDGLAWGTRLVSDGGRSPVGCRDMVGQVWEWTSSTFTPYPGFRPYPYDDYSKTWFDGEHRVLRGGSWATSGSLCRASFRNWYHPFVREIFAGFRCAAD